MGVGVEGGGLTDMTLTDRHQKETATESSILTQTDAHLHSLVTEAETESDSVTVSERKTG